MNVLAKLCEGTNDGRMMKVYEDEWTVAFMDIAKDVNPAYPTLRDCRFNVGQGMHDKVVKVWN